MATPAFLRDPANLTPDDFAAVQRQLQHAPANSAEEIVDRLSREVRSRPERGRIGF
jgi:hypothetical protein